jgi:hypothetical protein
MQKGISGAAPGPLTPTAGWGLGSLALATSILTRDDFNSRHRTSAGAYRTKVLGALEVQGRDLEAPCLGPVVRTATLSKCEIAVNNGMQPRWCARGPQQLR